PMVRAVLEQAWTDVLALTLLRQGEESQAYRRCLAVADQLMQIGSGKDLAKVDATVREEVRNGLLQVGLHGDEAEGVLVKLFDPGSVEKKTSHTELAHALKSKARLGGESAPVGKAAREAGAAAARGSVPRKGKSCSATAPGPSVPGSKSSSTSKARRCGASWRGSRPWPCAACS